MSRPNVRARPFGTTSGGVAVTRYDLAAGDGSGVSVLDWGAVVVEVRVPDRHGHLANVVLGHPDLAGYERNDAYLGAVVGRVANRIAGARFDLDGRTVSLPANEGPHHLHGGPGGFHVRPWRAEAAEPAPDEVAALRLCRTSPDGEEGYPGVVEAAVRIAWTASHELRIAFRARTNAPTPLNLAHHGYWNLAGEGSGDVADHELEVTADAYLPVDGESIPTGEVAPVAGTPLDLRRPRRLADVVCNDHPQLRRAGGLDHAFVLREGAGSAARLVDVRSGRAMTVRTTCPSLQVYTGNAFDGRIVGRSGRPYVRHAGVALEAQGFPDAPNRREFPSVILRPGETYRSGTVYAFGVWAGRGGRREDDPERGEASGIVDR